MAKETVEERLARLESLMDQVVASPRVRPYMLGQVEQPYNPAALVEPTNELKEKFRPSKEEEAAEEEVKRCLAAVDRIRFAQVQEKIVMAGRYLIEDPVKGTRYVTEINEAEAAMANSGGFAIELTPELKEAEAKVIKAKIRLHKIQRDRDAKARAWTMEQSGLKPGPAAKVATRRRL
jgi:hypothetical protein